MNLKHCDGIRRGEQTTNCKRKLLYLTFSVILTVRVQYNIAPFSVQNCSSSCSAFTDNSDLHH